MADVPLGKSAYRRIYGQEPEIKMVNRFFEQDPTNPVSGNALLTRPGTSLLWTVGDGPIRGTKTQSGAFNSDMFIVSAQTLYRVAPDGTQIEITGTINYGRRPEMTVAVGPSYEYLFISDGETLQLYEGLSCSRGTLSEDTGGAVADGDQVRIGDVYYQFTNGSVDTGTPDGTSANPWLVALGTAKASARLQFISAGRIDIAGYAVFIGNIPEGTPPGEGGDLRFVYTMSAPDELERNNPRGTGDNPWRLATPEGITALSYLTLLKKAINGSGTPGVDYSRELVDPHPLVTADEVAGPSSPADPRENYLTIRAVEGGSEGNDIQVRNVLDRAPIFRWEDSAGNPVTSLTGGSDVAGDAESVMANLARAIGATGIPGTDYSTDLTAHPAVRVESIVGTTLTVSACGDAVDNTMPTTTTSTGLAWGGVTLSGGGEHRLDPVPMPDGNPAGALETLAGFVVVSVAGGDRFYWLRPGARTIDPLDFSTAESGPDEIADILTLADQLVIIGVSSIEFWSPTGNVEQAFLPSRGQTLNIGAIQSSAVRARDRILFVGIDGVVYQTTGGPEQRVSNSGIEERLRQQFLTEASGRGINTFLFDQDGHTFFVMHLDETARANTSDDPNAGVPLSDPPYLVIGTQSLNSIRDLRLYNTGAVPFTLGVQINDSPTSTTALTIAWSGVDGLFAAGFQDSPFLQVYRYEEPSPVRLGLSAAPVNDVIGVRFSRSGTYLGVADGGSDLKVYNTSTDPLNLVVDYFIKDSAPKDVCFSPLDDYIVLVGGGSPYLWLFSFDTVTETVTLLADPTTTEATRHLACDWSQDGRYVAIGRDNTATKEVSVYDVSDPENWVELPVDVQPTGGVITEAMEFSANGNYLAVITGNFTPYFHLYKIEGGTVTLLPSALPAALPDEPTSLNWANNDKWLGIGLRSSPFTHIYEWDGATETFTLLPNLDPIPEARVLGIAFAAAGWEYTP